MKDPNCDVTAFISYNRFLLGIDFSQSFSGIYVETYSEPCQSSKIEFFAKTVNGYKPLNIF